MVDLVVTAANVVVGTDPVVVHGYAGATITAGQAVFWDTATKRYLLADNNAVNPEARVPKGVALNSASAGQPIQVQRAGEITMGATLVLGTAYFLSDTPGGIAPAADLASGEHVTMIGIARTAAILVLKITDSGATI